jgi:hypothetical protein
VGLQARKQLTIQECPGLTALPSCLAEVEHLTTQFCKRLQDRPGSVKAPGFRLFSEHIHDLKPLKQLPDPGVEDLPFTIGPVRRIKHLTIEDCSSSEVLGTLRDVEVDYLTINGCQSLPLSIAGLEVWNMQR